MRRFRIFYLLLLAGALGFGLSAAAYGQGGPRSPEVHTRFTPDTIMIGDQFYLHLDIDKDVAQEIQLPRFEKNRLTPQIEVLGIDRVDTLGQNGRRLQVRVTYRLTSFDEGTHTLGGFPVVWSSSPGQARDGKADTVLAPEQMRLTVGTFEIDTAKQQIFDIKRPLNTPLVFAEIRDYVYWGVGIALALAVIIYLLIKYIRRRQGRTGPKRFVPPHIVAIRALEKLHSRKLWQNGKHKEYYSQLADIVRIYIERRYGIGAMEMTSDQILDAVRNVNDERLREKLRELFGLADLVKFAKMAPSPDDNEQAYFDAYFYVEETKELPEPGQGPAAPGATVTDTAGMPDDDPEPIPETEPEEENR